MTTSFVEWRKKISHLPIVEYISFSLFNLMNKKGISLIKEKNKGKILITHDTDSTNDSNLLEIIYNITKGLIRCNKNFLKKGLNGIINMNKPYFKNVNYGFEKWIEKFPHLKHTFFLSLSGIGAKRHINDPRSSASDKIFPWQNLQNIINKKNIEIDFKPGINVKYKQISYSNLKHYIQNKITKNKIIGLRHHYWSLNWKKNYLSYRKMVNSGFRYDCTMSYQDTFGLRAGTSKPFRPFDLEYLRPLNIYVIPTCLMDSMFDPLDVKKQKKLSQMFEEIKKVDGVINLDWHTESAANQFPFENYIDNFRLILDLINIKEVDSVLPSELIQKWHSKINPILNLYPNLKL